MSLLSFSTRIINIIVDIERNVCEVQLREMNRRNDLALAGKFSGAHVKQLLKLSSKCEDDFFNSL